MNKNNFVIGKTFEELLTSQRKFANAIRILERRFRDYKDEFVQDNRQTIREDSIVDEHYTITTRNKKNILRMVNSDILTEKWKMEEELKCCVTFDNFSEDESTTCMHYLVNTGTELKCLFCGASTKDYGLTKEEFSILAKAAELTGKLLPDATLDNASYLKILLTKRSNVTPDYSGLSKMNIMEEEYLCGISVIRDLNREIRSANERDSSSINGYYKANKRDKFISKDEAGEILLKLSKDLEEAKNSESSYKELFIEECKTAIYEVLILSGRSIPSLIDEAKDEDDLKALTKAYYDLSNPIFRQHCNYFIGNYTNAIGFNCVTAREEINSRILEMTLKR